MTHFKRVLILIFTGFISRADLVQYTATHQATQEETWKAMQINHKINESFLRLPKIFNLVDAVRPATDFDHFRFLLMSGDHQGSVESKKNIILNLPSGVQLVLLVGPGKIPQVKSEFSAWTDPNKILFVEHSSAVGGFWARDAYPYPVRAVQRSAVSLIGARYYRAFSAQAALAQKTGYTIKQYEHVFVGGNLLADETGRCLVVQSSRLFGVTDDILKMSYGCVSVHRFPHVAGIGDVDEVIKILPGRKVLTNQPSYQAMLSNMGYQVQLLPQAGGNRTYANSLLIQSTAFVPSYQGTGEIQAREIYSKLGYKVVMVESRYLSDELSGSVHCMTMAYP